MSKQRESLLIADPMTAHARALGWHVENITASQFLKGIPDCVMGKNGLPQKWVEWKVIEEGGSIKFTKAQLDKFPKLIANGFKLWVICTPWNQPLHGPANWGLRDRLWRKIMGRPNGHLMLGPKSMWKLMY